MKLSTEEIDERLRKKILGWADMKAVDTNLLVRFLVVDDPDQAAKVKEILEAAETSKALDNSDPVGLTMWTKLGA